MGLEDGYEGCTTAVHPRFKQPVIFPTGPDADMEAGLGAWPCVEPGPFSAWAAKNLLARRSGGV
jgi:hypothetical protein